MPMSIFGFLSIWLISADVWKKYVRIFAYNFFMLANQFSNLSHLRPLNFLGGASSSV